MCTVVVVLGTMVCDDGTIDEGYKNRVGCAIKTVEALPPEQPWFLVLTGGQTRAGLPAEAIAALRYVEEEYPDFAAEQKDRILWEDCSRDTPENIEFVKRLLDYQKISPSKIIIIGRTPQMPKVGVIVWRLWKRENDLPHFEYVGINDPTTPLWERIVDPTIITLLSIFDPRGHLLRHVLKRNR